MLTTQLFATLLYVTAGLAVVLILRKPARRLFGAGPAFTLWLLPLLLAALPWLPALPAAWTITTPVLLAPPTATALAQPTTTALISTPALLLWVWLIGGLLALIRLAAHYVRLLRQSQHISPAMQRRLQPELSGLSVRRVRLHGAGPALLWAPRIWLLLPPDFFERFTTDQRRLVLRHESAHLRRGDAWWSLLSELTSALLWFHPLAWLALPRLRLDQELACDEQVLRQSPTDEPAYAHTLLHSTGVDAIPALVPWLAEPQLKERLNMIQRQRPGVLRRRIGFIGLSTLMAGSVFMVQATAQTPVSKTASSNLSYNSQIQPVYPTDAVENKQEGTVILRVLVGKTGAPIKAEAQPNTKATPSMVQSAINAAMKWRFNPAVENGKPIESYALVPVKFSLDESKADTAEPTTKSHPNSAARHTQPAAPMPPAPPVPPTPPAAPPPPPPPALPPPPPMPQS